MRRRTVLVACTLLLGLAVGSADARIPPQWKNCAAVNKSYPHGVGKVGAHDKTPDQPVTKAATSSSGSG
jgi:hypothetical protein